MGSDDLRRRKRHLDEALADIDHNIRRERDKLERAGGRDRALEQRLKALRENRKLTERDQAALEKQLRGS